MDRFMTLIETVMKLTVYNMFVAAVLLGLIKDLKNYDDYKLYKAIRARNI